MRAHRRPPWNHNVAYHPRVLAAGPAPCRRALDVGCGQGFLLAELAGRCDEVVGVAPTGRRWPPPPRGSPATPT